MNQNRNMQEMLARQEYYSQQVLAVVKEALKEGIAIQIDPSTAQLDALDPDWLIYNVSSQMPLVINDRYLPQPASITASAIFMRRRPADVPADAEDVQYEMLGQYLPEAAVVTGDEGGVEVDEEVITDASASTKSPITRTESGLCINDMVVGDGVEAKAGQNVTVHYTGWLQNADGSLGQKFDSSKDRNDPFEFALGAGLVIRGWDEGVRGMRVGGTRQLIIPSDLGYGSRGAGGIIPPHATLVFEVDLLAV